MNGSILVHILVISLSPGWWVIIQRNFFLGLLLLILSLTVFIYFFQNKSKILLFLFLLLTGIIFIISIGQAFDGSIFRNSALDIQQLNKRHEFYAKGLGKIYTNRISLTYFKNFNLPLAKLQHNFFGNLDPNLYFFASHPRERLGIEEFKKYSPIFLPFFLIGALYSIYVPLFGILIYSISVLFLSSIISPAYELGPMLFFPIVNFMVTIGIVLSIKEIAKIFKKRK